MVLLGKAVANRRHEQNKKTPPDEPMGGNILEPETRFELVTAALRKRCSTPELLWQKKSRSTLADRLYGAGCYPAGQ